MTKNRQKDERKTDKKEKKPKKNQAQIFRDFLLYLADYMAFSPILFIVLNKIKKKCSALAQFKASLRSQIDFLFGYF